MDELHKKAIIKSYIYLVNNLDFNDIGDYLIQEEILNEEHCEEIKARNTRAERVREFLRILQTRGPRAYDTFIKALNKSNNGFIASHLEKIRETLGVLSPTAQNTAPPWYAGVNQEPNQPVTSSGRQVAQVTNESMTGVKQTVQPQDVEMKNVDWIDGLTDDVRYQGHISIDMLLKDPNRYRPCRKSTIITAMVMKNLMPVNNAGGDNSKKVEIALMDHTAAIRGYFQKGALSIVEKAVTRNKAISISNFSMGTDCIYINGYSNVVMTLHSLPIPPDIEKQAANILMDNTFLSIESIKKMPDKQKVSFKGKVTKVVHKRKVKTKSGEYVSVLSFLVKDETGIIKVTAWRGKADSLTISQNDAVSIEHGVTSTYQDEQKVDANTHTIITVLEETLDSIHISPEDCSQLQLPQAEKGKITGVGNIMDYKACPNAQCYFSKLLENQHCRKCEQKPQEAAFGYVATFGLVEEKSDEMIMIKAFTDTLEQLYVGIIPGCTMPLDKEEIENCLLDMIPLNVEYRLNRKQYPPIATILKVINK